MIRISAIRTAEQLERAGDIGRCELVRGQVVMMSPSGARHGVVVATLTTHLGHHIKANGLGVLCGAETGFVISRAPDSVRAPDIAFVRADRAAEVLVGGFGRGTPDLAVEVLSPSDRTARVAAKVADWLQSGCRAVWVIDPASRMVTTHQPDRQPATFRDSDVLIDEVLLPGFVLPVASIFEDLPERR